MHLNTDIASNYTILRTCLSSFFQMFLRRSMLLRFFFLGGTVLDITVYLLLLAEAMLALALLHLSGVLKKPWHVLLSAGLLTLAFILRGVCLNYETLDYQVVMFTDSA